MCSSNGHEAGVGGKGAGAGAAAAAVFCCRPHAASTSSLIRQALSGSTWQVGWRGWGWGGKGMEGAGRFAPPAQLVRNCRGDLLVNGGCKWGLVLVCIRRLLQSGLLRVYPLLEQMGRG